MRKSRYSEAQIVGILKEHYAGLGAEFNGAPSRLERHVIKLFSMISALIVVQSPGTLWSASSR